MYRNQTYSNIGTRDDIFVFNDITNNVNKNNYKAQIIGIRAFFNYIFNNGFCFSTTPIQCATCNNKNKIQLKPEKDANKRDSHARNLKESSIKKNVFHLERLSI